MASEHRQALVFLPVAVIALLIVLVSGAGGFATFYTDLLWYRELGQESVFWKTFSTQWTTGLAFGVGFFALLYGNLRVARFMAPKAVVVPTGDFRAQLEQSIYLLRERLNPYVELILLGGSVLLAVGFGSTAGGQWQTFQLALHAVPFGRSDPQFGRDISYFVFTLPVLRFLADWLFGALSLALIVTTAVHVYDGAIRPWARLRGFEPHVKAHLSVLLGLIAVVKVLDYYLRTFELNFSTGGVVTGASYTDVYAQLPALRILMVVAALSAVSLLVNIRFRGWKLPVFALGIWIAASVLVGGVYPSLVQRFRVSPNEVAAEAPFISRSIEATRHAFDLDTVEVRPFAAAETLTAADISSPEHQSTLSNIRLWDPSVAGQSYKQLQEIRFYYDFHDVDIDRYTIDGARRQVLISARELNVGQLSEQARTWVNQHLVYTHGYGAVVSPVSDTSTNGLPTFLVKDIPPVTETDLKITQPAIYFGEETTTYAIAKTALPEFDYPVGDKNAFKSYDGKGGIPVGGFFQQALFALRFGSAKILLSEYIRPDSRVLFARSLSERVGRLAPWLSLDRDPYPAVVEGRLIWILDGYTHSNHYPYAQRVQGGLNYIRNSVKVTIDAYDGTTTLYAFDGKDPVLAAWRGVFPGLIADGARMPAGVRDHLRYPEDLFRIQAEMYKIYHMGDPQVFYNKEDQWAIPGDKGDRKGGADREMKPFYVQMRLPGEKTDEFMIMLPFTPRNKDNMIGWMAAKADPGEYGKRVVYTFPKQRLVLGPEQVSARVNQDPVISPELTLWNQRGSSVLFGNLLVLPIKDSIVYIQPLYLQAEQTAMPALTRVIVAYADRVAMEPDLATALAKVFGASVSISGQGPSPSPVAGQAPASASAPVVGDLTTARVLYQKALEAQKAGDWAAYGRNIGELGKLLDQLAPGKSASGAAKREARR